MRLSTMATALQPSKPCDRTSPGTWRSDWLGMRPTSSMSWSRHRSEVIASRMDENPHQNPVVPKKDIKKILSRF